ncbi:MAG: hypothetical protein JXB33_01635 [Clostridia bacterium]|nr:hypothetical protein [Clostridia bacterium]
MKETDLYPPVKEFLESQGYSIRSEVMDADIAAVKDGRLLIVELKTSINLKLLTQLVKRQRMTDSVYAAVPRPAYKRRFGKDFRDKAYLLRRLGIGLILVALDAREPYAAVEFEPGSFDMKRSRASSSGRTAGLIREIEGRSADFNKAGSVRSKLVTSYRENSLRAAYEMRNKEAMSTTELKNAGCTPGITRILYDNHYGWFERTGRGCYRLSDSGKTALEEYKAIINHIVAND